MGLPMFDNLTPIPVDTVGSWEELAPRRNSRPIFVVAYWPKGNWWKIHPELFSSTGLPIFVDYVNDLREKGWTHVTVCQLPDLPLRKETADADAKNRD